VDLFDADAGGDDVLYGRGGDDVYYLGYGTGRDTIDEGYLNSVVGDDGDVIRLKANVDDANVRLRRNADDLYVQLLDSDGSVSDWFKVSNYYLGANYRIESVEREDGTILFDADDFAAVRIRGEAGVDRLLGSSEFVDLFDADAGGDDVLYGKSGDDVYYLGYGTGRDRINEGYLNSVGDDGDVIRLKANVDDANVRLRRYADDLYVQLLDNDGSVSDWFKVSNYYPGANYRIESVEREDGTTLFDADDFAAVRIRGEAGVDRLLGSSEFVDLFDADAGGDDMLYGKSGDDVYYLGYGTGRDTIDEGYRNIVGDDGDTIRLKADVNDVNVRLWRDSNNLFVQLLDSNRLVSDWLKVSNHYSDANHRIESVERADGTTLFDTNALAMAPIHGGTENDLLVGRHGFTDIFDADAGGDDKLQGRSGDDVYYLGYGTGQDKVNDGYRNRSGDDGDVIRLKAGIDVEDLRLRRENNDLIVELLGEADDKGVRTADDALRVALHFIRNNYRIERIEAGDRVLLDDQIDALISAMARFEAGDSDYQSASEVSDDYWQALAPPAA
jgi:Ca2+-binding RTX toxin-like protein